MYNYDKHREIEVQLDRDIWDVLFYHLGRPALKERREYLRQLERAIFEAVTANEPGHYENSQQLAAA